MSRLDDTLGRIGRLGGRRPEGFPWSAPTWPASVDRPAPQRRLGVDYDTSWSRRYPARVARAVLLDNVTRPLTHLVATPSVQGVEMLDLVSPPVILVANHASHVDTPLLLSVLPLPLRHRTIVAAAADHFFDRRWKAHLWAGALAAIPIERNKVNRRSADVAAELIAEGWSLVIFPEGGRSPDGWLQPFRGGAAYLAARTGRPVVPVHLSGTWRVLPKRGGRLRRSPTSVIFGTPLHPEPSEDARRLGARIEQAVATLASEERSDWWTARRMAAGQPVPLQPPVGREGEAGAGPLPPSGPAGSPWRRAWALDQGQDDAEKRDWAAGGRRRKAGHGLRRHPAAGQSLG